MDDKIAIFAGCDVIAGGDNNRAVELFDNCGTRECRIAWQVVAPIDRCVMNRSIENDRSAFVHSQLGLSACGINQARQINRLTDPDD